MAERKAKIISITNSKGGVTKTTTSSWLAREIAKGKNKVLLIDSDPQGSLTELIDLYQHFDKDFLDTFKKENNFVKIFKRETIEPLNITSIITDGHKSEVKIGELHFIQSPGKELAFAAESAEMGRDLLLNKFLNKIKKEYDYIIIDSLPAVSTLFYNVLLASDALIIPIETKSAAIAGANDMIKTIDEIMEDYDKEYSNIFILPTIYNKIRNDDKEVLAEIKTTYLEFIKSTKNVKNAKIEILPEIPERSIFSTAQGSRYFLQDYITSFARGKKDILLKIKDVTKKIIKSLKEK